MGPEGERDLGMLLLTIQGVGGCAAILSLIPQFANSEESVPGTDMLAPVEFATGDER